ncbi:ADP-ribose pyrophosphatase YjhB, NUDIX family [Amycolatopsis arida]|uniref:ADP-ribose pyrophosphatase YjhB, NUDIX family n=1 Tax=Amycolatopsis arida TaxID=587909 RepID=A0A1I5XWK0_9PSEU|nr:NUDIX domain-containing protein [Amycolatopsis arida]TDX97222.1 ADP-ribose pyrophosphatase YjhB (NUDIX family) [Amycolatopsis arida]SFQ36329.1 ADP-ribose pyrophosphatase YjhB, NUDIX family [Amycolatopsis arida]
MVHEVLAAVLQVRYATSGPPTLRVLLWRRALDPHIGRWSLPGGRLRPDEDVEASIRRQLAEKVDVKQLSHVEQLAVFSAPDRVPGPRVVATAFLGLVPTGVDPEVPEDTAWHELDALPRTAFDHGAIALRARDRLRAKLCYTNLGFALAPKEFTVSTLRDLYSAALGYRVSATNLQRVLSRRGLLAPTGGTAVPGRAGGRPAALYSFTGKGIQVTDPFAVFRPPARPPRRPARRAAPS